MDSFWFVVRRKLVVRRNKKKIETIQIFSGQFFEAVLASEAKPDFTNGLILAQNPFLPLFRVVT